MQLKKDVIKLILTNECINMFEKNAKFIEHKKDFKRFAKTMEAELNENDVPDTIIVDSKINRFSRTIEVELKPYQSIFYTVPEIPKEWIKIDADTTSFVNLS
jgi:hypothetical protein